MSGRVLVAGVGNIFLSDDGFGVEVANLLARTSLPGGAEVADIGIRGVHLAYQLLDGYDVLVLVDAVQRGDPPGTLTVLEPEAGEPLDLGAVPGLDAHGADPLAVLDHLERLGGSVGRVLVVGCEAASVEEGIGLSPDVAAAVPRAGQLVSELLASLSETVSTKGAPS